MLSSITDKVFLPTGGELLPLTPTSILSPTSVFKICPYILVPTSFLKYLRTLLKIEQTRNSYHLYLCVSMCTHVCVEVKVQLVEVSSLLPLCGFQGLT